MKALWLTLLLGSIIWAEEDYFHIFFNARWNEYRFLQQNLTWDEARNHCQACFNDLTTVTSRNAHLVVLQNTSLDFWTGLRKDNGSWSRWSNKDPITYQNWYPGHPIPNKVKNMIPVCYTTTQSPLSSAMTTSTSTPVTSTPTSTVTSPVTSSNKTDDVCPILYDILSCLNMTFDEFESTVHSYKITPKTTAYTTTPTATTVSTSYSTATNSPTTDSTTNSNCILVPEPDREVFIEDACVVLLSNGMWKEKECNQSLPFICYDVHFVGEINVSNEITNAADLSWSAAPGNITHYRVEITNKTNFSTVFNVSGLYKRMENLTPGNRYNIQVFPVKCGRDLNPQNISFYTLPSGVENLKVVSVTTDSINLIWSKPYGDSDFYLVNVVNLMNKTEKIDKTKCDKVECNIASLNPGYEYEFTVAAIVNEITHGVPMTVSEYTMPSHVKNLKSADNDSTVITAFWEAPDGTHSGYSYCLKVYNANDCTKCDISDCTNTRSNTIQEGNKTDGTIYCLCVAALTKNDTLQGQAVGISAYTLPRKVNLTLTSNMTCIRANWAINGSYERFKVKITTDAYNFTREIQTPNLEYTFTGLISGVTYTVTVVTLNGALSSEAAIESAYTRPSKPESLIATAHKNTITLTWTASNESQGAVINYNVKYYSVFWEYGSEINTTNTAWTFSTLKTGTKYDFAVSAVVGSEMSLPATTSCQTEPEKRTLILAMMCSSKTPLHCEKNTTMEELFTNLYDKFKGNFHDHVHWNLKWVERKKGSLN